jgi:Flp pilus assembly protein TadD
LDAGYGGPDSRTPYRGMAYARLGDTNNARSDIETAVRLDPSLERYVTAKQ